MGWNCSRDLASELILVEERMGMACLGISNDRGLGEQARQASARERGGMAPAQPSSPGAFVTKAIFLRLTKLQVQEHPRSALCAALHVTPSTQTWSPTSVTSFPSKAELGPSARQQGRICWAAAAFPLLLLTSDPLGSTPTTTLSSFGGSGPPVPAPRRSVHQGVNNCILTLFLTSHLSN